MSRPNGVTPLSATRCILTGALGAYAALHAVRWWQKYRRRRQKLPRTRGTAFKPCERLSRACIQEFLGPREVLDELQCPLCLDTMLDPCRLQCGHHLCPDCAGHLMSVPHGRTCPRCAQHVQGDATLAPSPGIEAQLGMVIVKCAGCASWQGPLRELWEHITHECPRGNVRVCAGLYSKLVSDAQSQGSEPSAIEEERSVLRNLDRMRSSGAHFVGRFSAAEMDSLDCFSPVFFSFNYLWALSIERCNGGEVRMMLHPFDGHVQRVRFNLILARRTGYESFYVSNWPERLVGMPWGYRFSEDLWETCLQYDGSVLVMVHCVEMIPAANLSIAQEFASTSTNE